MGAAAGVGGLLLNPLAAHATEAGSGRLSFARDPSQPLSRLPPQFAAKARRVIYLHMGGSPSQLELFDHKPVLTKYNGTDCPQSFLEGKRFAFISGVPKLMGSLYTFRQVGQSGAWVSDRLPHLAKHVDDICFIKSMRTDQFNHAPAQLMMQTGSARLGSPSMGSWVTYGLGTENQNLPGFIVLISGTNAPDGGKHLWGSGFLPSVYQGVECRSNGEPVLYLHNPPGVSRTQRRDVLDAVAQINRQTQEAIGDQETSTRTAQFEMAYRMQLEASDAMDIRKEPASVLKSYGAEPGESSFANNCVIARRLAERGVRFIQLYDANWDAHGGTLESGMERRMVQRCLETDQPTAALLSDLKSRGLLEDTLLVWGAEFGRTSMREGRGDPEFPGRDHNPSAFTMWIAGGGVKAGITHGETDELGYEVARDPVEVRDLHATLLYQLGMDHRKLIYPFQGLDQKLTGVKQARVVSEILA